MKTNKQIVFTKNTRAQLEKFNKGAIENGEITYNLELTEDEIIEQIFPCGEITKGFDGSLWFEDEGSDPDEIFDNKYGISHGDGLDIEFKIV